METKVHFNCNRPYYSGGEKRKILIRSTGSFSTIEENIVAPTPRKFPNLASCSPKYGRRDKRMTEQTSLFGEAGSEIQNIFLHPQNLLAAATQLVTVAPPTSSTPLEETSNTIVPVKITPLRTSNPMTLNSPFHAEDRTTVVEKVEKSPITTTTARLYPASRTRTNTHYPSSSRKELNRSRSLSWPGNSSMMEK